MKLTPLPRPTPKLCPLTLRVTEEQRRVIAERCRETGMTASTLLRVWIDGGAKL